MPNSIIATREGDPLDNMEHRMVTVNQTSVVVAEQNPKRRSLVLVNDSNDLIYVTYGIPAQLHLGFRLEKNGGILPLHGCCQFKVYAISTATGSKLLVNEGT